MADYKISGVWKDTNRVITDYAMHRVNPSTGEFSRASKVSKAEAIKIVETKGNTAFTWVWDYVRSDWNEGEEVIVVGTGSGKYLRTKPDRKLTDNLDHLIDYDWIIL